MDRRDRRLGITDLGCQKRLKGFEGEAEIGHEAFTDKELEVSLSGNLGFVSLDEVLRLLIRSGQRGRVAVRGETVEGRVFVTRGGITLATTMTDEGLETLFRKSRMIDPQRFASGQVDTDDQEVIDLIREVTVESIYRLNLHGDSFDVTEGVEARFASPRPFELEQLLEESRKRLEDWAEVSQVVSDLDARLGFVRDLGEREEVRIRRDAWKVLSEVGAGASIAQVAEELGTTEFWAARVVARLVEDDLLSTEGGSSVESEVEETMPTTAHATPAADEVGARESEADTEPERAPAETWETPGEPVYEERVAEHAYSSDYPERVESPEHEDEPAGYFQETPEAYDETHEPVQEPEWQEPVSFETTDEDEPTTRDVDADKSWWEEPSDEVDDASSAEDDEDGDGDVEEDTEAFLEKVFSELDSSEEGEEEGYGLLRRRRLGAIRDIARDSQ